MKYVTFWTPDYINPITLLKKTALKHGIDLYAEEIKKDASWRNIVRRKPRFIWRMMRKFRNHEVVVWIDADSLFLRNPGDFHPKKADVGYRTWPRPHGFVEPIASVLTFRNTPEVRGVVNSWAEMTEELKPETQRPEQRTLAHITSKGQLKGKQFKKDIVVQNNLGPCEYDEEKLKAAIWTTRWLPAKRAEEHAYMEKAERENGTWDKRKWEFCVL